MTAVAEKDIAHHTLDIGRILLMLKCIIGVYASFMIYAFYQEAIFVQEYAPDQRFKYTWFLILAQSVLSTLSCLIALQLGGNRTRSTTSLSSYFQLSITQTAASFCSNAALKYVTYPTQVIVKSCKMVPVMLVSSIVAKKRYEARQYLCMIMISGGISIFMLGKGKAKKGGVSESDPFGIVLCLVSLFMDGLTGGYQEKIKTKSNPSTAELALFMNACSLPILLVACLVTGEGMEGLRFCIAHPAIARDIALMSCFFVVGQHFIFTTISNFGALACTVLTTTRKFFTILFSVFWYGHPVTAAQWGGVVLVFAALGMELAAKVAQDRERKKKQHVK